MNAVPIFEAKNKFPYFVHTAETEGAVPVSRHNNIVAYIISKDEYEKMMVKPKKSIIDSLKERRRYYGLDDDDFDYTEYFDSLRDRNYFGRDVDKNIFDED